MKKLFLFMILCSSFTVNAEMILPDGVLFAAVVEQDNPAYSVILKNDASESVATNTNKTNRHFEVSLTEKERLFNDCFIAASILKVKTVIDSNLSPLKPDKRIPF